MDAQLPNRWLDDSKRLLEYQIVPRIDRTALSLGGWGVVSGGDRGDFESLNRRR
jgi:hypothetical protein